MTEQEMANDLQEIGIIEQFEGLFVNHIFPIYHYIRQDKWMTYCLYTYLTLFIIHVITKYLRRKLTKKQPPFQYSNQSSQAQSQNLGQLETEIKEIKTFLKDLTSHNADSEMIQQIQKQSGSIAMIQQNFQKFTTMQEEFQRTLLQTQAKMLTHMSKTFSQHSNNNQSVSSNKKFELSFQKQDSPRSQADSQSQGGHQRTFSKGTKVELQETQDEQTYRRKQSGADKNDIFTPQTTSRDIRSHPINVTLV